jgi:hypothetical protein
LTPGANLSPRGEFCPQGVKLSPGGEILCSPLHSSTHSRECSPLGVNEGVNIPPRGRISPLGARGEVTNGPLVTLTMSTFAFLHTLGRRCGFSVRNPERGDPANVCRTIRQRILQLCQRQRKSGDGSCLCRSRWLETEIR